MQSEASIRRAAARLDTALEAGDVEQVVACFAPDCTIELLGVRLDSHEGVRRWLGWVFDHVERIEFRPRLISVDVDTLIEEFGVTSVLGDGRRLSGQWAEILTYRDDLVASLRLYFEFRRVRSGSRVDRTGGRPGSELADAPRSRALPEDR